MKRITTRKRCSEYCEGELIATCNNYGYFAISNYPGTTYCHRCSACNREVWLSESFPKEHYEFTKKEIKEVWE